MKHLFFSLALLFCSAPLAASEFRPTVIQSPLVKAIDGFNITPVIGCRDCVHTMLQHNFAKPGAAPVTLSMLVELEHTLGNAHKAQILRTLITNLINLMYQEGYMQEFEAIQSIFAELITQWAEQNNRPDTLLQVLAHQTGTAGAECDILCEKITSLKLYHNFLRDLEEFLSDLMLSCPKSMAHYETAVAKLSSAQNRS